MEDPPTDLPAVKVELRPVARPVQARARRGGPEKQTLKKLRTNLGRCWDGGSGLRIAVCQPSNGGRETVIGTSEGTA